MMDGQWMDKVIDSMVGWMIGDVDGWLDGSWMDGVVGSMAGWWMDHMGDAMVGVMNGKIDRVVTGYLGVRCIDGMAG